MPILGIVGLDLLLLAIASARHYGCFARAATSELQAEAQLE